MQNNKILKDIRSLIKNLYQLVDKSSSGITIKSMHDCAQIISKLHGFSSWNDLKHHMTSFKKQETDALRTIETNWITPIAPPEFTTIEVERNIISFKKKDVEILDKILNEKNLIPEIIIGKKFIPALKSTKFISLKPENFLIISTVSEKKLLNPIKKQLKEFGHSYISLGEGNSGKQIKLDPWGNIFAQEGIENFFHINEQKNEFMLSWISVLRYLYHEFNFMPSTQEALYYLTLPGVLKLYDWLKNNKQSAYWYFQRHLEKIGIIKTDDNYLISKELQEKHWEHIKNEYSVLFKLNQMYKENTFKKHDSDILWKTISSGQNINIGLCELDNPNLLFYKEMVFSELNRIFNKYQKEIKNKIESNYSIWFFCENLELWEHSSLKDLMDKEFLIKGLISTGNLKKSVPIDIFSLNQIIFLKCMDIDLPVELTSRMLNETQKWEENIWYDEMRKIKELNENKGFFWSAEKETDTIKELWSFQIEKFDVYDKFADQ